MRFVLAFLFALVLSLPAFAAPTLSSAPYATTAPQPDTVTTTANGQPGPACVLQKNADNSLTPKCDLVSLTPGQYSLVMTAVITAKCNPQVSPAVCTQAGSASSVPFSLSMQSGNVAAPTALRLDPN
jgi:hypothetical protein